MEGASNESVSLIIIIPPHARCICPFTGEHFIAPNMESIDPDGRPLGEYEDVDLSHHIDRVSVQCAGNRPNTTGPEASLGSASLRDWPRNVRHHGACS